MTTIDQIQHYTLPAAYALLPPALASPEASAMLLAIGLQETRFGDRRQLAGGPARGFWQFEIGGIDGVRGATPGLYLGLGGVLTHPATGPLLRAALEALCYAGASAAVCLGLVENNDVLAAVFARLLLWTLPAPLPGRAETRAAWEMYADAWRPGRPHFDQWRTCYTDAWARVAPGARR